MLFNMKTVPLPKNNKKTMQISVVTAYQTREPSETSEKVAF
jgi:hypothetical protein